MNTPAGKVLNRVVAGPAKAPAVVKTIEIQRGGLDDVLGPRKCARPWRAYNAVGNIELACAAEMMRGRGNCDAAVEREQFICGVRPCQDTDSCPPECRHAKLHNRACLLILAVVHSRTASG